MHLWHSDQQTPVLRWPLKSLMPLLFIFLLFPLSFFAIEERTLSRRPELHVWSESFTKNLFEASLWVARTERGNFVEIKGEVFKGNFTPYAKGCPFFVIVPFSSYHSWLCNFAFQLVELGRCDNKSQMHCSHEGLFSMFLITQICLLGKAV